jgi:hypothetical protein
MHIIQILLPLQDNNGDSYPTDYYTQLAAELTDKYGGLTAYTRSPATGLWKEAPNKTVKDDIVIFEVMAENFNEGVLKLLKEGLEKKFAQREILIRGFEIRLVS